MFFDKYPKFYTTSTVGTSPNRLNQRYLALIDFNKKIIENSTILDLGSHDGRWSFAAIKHGAKHVTGIEGRKELIQKSITNMKEYDISQDKFSFIEGNMMNEIKNFKEGKFDVVFCFGIFYHLMDHWLLLNQIKNLNPHYLILDTRILISSRPIILLKKEDSRKEAASLQNPATRSFHTIVGYPSMPALEMMLHELNFSFSYYDWVKNVNNWDGLQDYQNHKRVTLIAKNENSFNNRN